MKLVQQILGRNDATATSNKYAALWEVKLDEFARKLDKRRNRAMRKAVKGRMQEVA